MRRTATMTSKGQVTVPVEVRRRLGLRQGDRVAFDVEDGVATLRPVPAE
ncbi:MAG: AbrB/MazE/SpoVT family DNA-binding domain-containing protein, partial [Trueperaceae bacterium]